MLLSLIVAIATTSSERVANERIAGRSYVWNFHLRNITNGL